MEQVCLEMVGNIDEFRKVGQTAMETVGGVFVVTRKPFIFLHCDWLTGGTAESPMCCSGGREQPVL